MANLASRKQVIIAVEVMSGLDNMMSILICFIKLVVGAFIVLMLHQILSENGKEE